MTSQTKHFIDLSDIVALRFECRRCHATVSLERSGEITVSSLRICPNCREPWAQRPEGSTIEVTIAKFIEQIKEFEEILRRRDELMIGGGFSLSLEIKSDAVSPAENKS
jgi:hypothetical protein